MISGLPPGVDLLGLASSFLLVIGLMAVVLFGLKRMQGLTGGLSNDRQIKHLETMSAGPRQKIILLRVKDRELLIGISAGQINTLAQWQDANTTGNAQQAKANEGGLTSSSLKETSGASLAAGSAAFAAAQRPSFGQALSAVSGAWGTDFLKRFRR
jgi:flagellar protein FliO/FliZ